MPSKEVGRPVGTLRYCELFHLQYIYPTKMPVTIAVLLLDIASDNVYMRFTTDWSGYRDDEIDVLSGLEDELLLQGHTMGGTALIQYLSSTLSNRLRISGGQAIQTIDIQTELDRRLASHVHVSPVHPVSNVIQERFQIAGGVCVATLVVVLCVNRLPNLPRSESVTPRQTPTAGRPKAVATVTNLTPSAPVPTRIAATRRITRRSSGGDHGAGAERSTFVPASTAPRYLPAHDVLITPEDDVIISGSPDVSYPPIGEVVFPAAPDRSANRVLQTLAKPFRKFGRLFAN